MGTFEWVSSREAWLNFAYGSIQKDHDASYSVIRRFYGRAPSLNYYLGESHGGRQALEAIGRYPLDYDGALVSALVYLTELWVRDFRNLQALAKPGAYLPASKLAAIERESVRRCDGLDGLTDGVVENYEACNRLFDPSLHPDASAARRCSGGVVAGDDCLSDAQLAAVKTLRAPGLTWANFNAADHAVALQRMSDEFDAPTDLMQFFVHGGKLIVHSPNNDYLTNGRAHVAAVEAVLARSGPAARRNLRFYVTPSGDHGSRGFSFPEKTSQPRQMDLVGALETWVEQDRAPPTAMEQTLWSLEAPFTVVRARPLCQYPLYPRYQSGSPDAQASYTCAAP